MSASRVTTRQIGEVTEWSQSGHRVVIPERVKLKQDNIIPKWTVPARGFAGDACSLG